MPISPPELMTLQAIRTCLLRARIFIDEHGNPTAPSLRQLRSYADSDVMPGKKIGRDWHVPKRVFLEFLARLQGLD